MKKILTAGLILFIIQNIYSLTINLKKEYLADKNLIYLQDITGENEIVPDIIVKSIINYPDKIYADEILKKLFENGIYNINIIGEFTIIRKSENYGKFIYINPVTDIENQFKKYLFPESDIKITVIDIKPDIDLYLINDDYQWKMPGFNNFIGEIQNLLTVPLMIKGKEYSVTMNINLSANIWISDIHYKKGDIISLSHFKSIKINVFDYKKYGTFVYNIKEAGNSIFTQDLNANEILRWEMIKKLPAVKRNEKLNLIIKNESLEIIIPCISMNDGFENEKIKVKLNNGNEIVGVIKKTGENKYAVYH